MAKATSTATTTPEGEDFIKAAGEPNGAAPEDAEPLAEEAPAEETPDEGKKHATRMYRAYREVDSDQTNMPGEPAVDLEWVANIKGTSPAHALQVAAEENESLTGEFVVIPASAHSKKKITVATKRAVAVE